MNYQQAIGFVLTLMFCVQSWAQSEDLVVSARGLGTTADAAKNDALVNAMQQAVGSFIDSETMIDNDEIIKDKILSVSDGFVQKYDITSPAARRSDGLFEIAIKATVQRGQVIARLKEVRVMKGGVAGKDAAAEVITKIANADQGQELLEKHLDGLLEKLLVARLVGEDGKPGEQVKPITKIQPDRRLLCQWNIEVYFDMNAFYQQAVPQLDKVFRAIATQTSGSIVCIGSRSNRLTAYTSYPVLSDPDWRGDNPNLSEKSEDIGILMSVGRDKFGENERFRCYSVNKNLYSGPLAQMSERAGAVKLRFYALDKTGGVIREEIISLDSTAQVSGQSLAPTREYAPTFLRFDDSFETDNRYTRSAFVLSPRFAEGPAIRDSSQRNYSLSRDQGYCDTLMIPFATMVEQDDLEKIAEVRFRFAR